MSKPAGYPYEPLKAPYDVAGPCGPTVLAGVLGVSCHEAIELMKRTNAKGWNGYTNVGHMRAALENKGLIFFKTSAFNDRSELPADTGKRLTALFIQLEGPWMGKGWRAEYSNTHWILADWDPEDGCTVILDVAGNFTRDNNLGWLDLETWTNLCIPGLVEWVPKATGWRVRGAYVVVERKA